MYPSKEKDEQPTRVRCGVGSLVHNPVKDVCHSYKRLCIVEPVKEWTTPAHGERWIACHPVDSQVTYEGKVWTVSQINLATGEHVITRPPSLSKASLRMIDMQPFIDEDEEL